MTDIASTTDKDHIASLLVNHEGGSLDAAALDFENTHSHAEIAHGEHGFVIHVHHKPNEATNCPTTGAARVDCHAFVKPQALAGKQEGK